MIAVAATGSVGETIAPSAKAIGHSRSSTSCPTTATSPIVTSTSPTDVSASARAWSRSARASDEEGRREQQWRQEHEQDQVGLQLDVGHARHEAERQAAQHQDDRVRDAATAGERVEEGHGHEQRGDDDLEPFHARESGGAATGGVEVMRAAAGL